MGTHCILCNDPGYCKDTISRYYADYDKICTKCNQFVCGRCNGGAWRDLLQFDADWDSFHCLKEDEKEDAKKTLRFLHEAPDKTASYSVVFDEGPHRMSVYSNLSL